MMNITYSISISSTIIFNFATLALWEMMWVRFEFPLSLRPGKCIQYQQQSKRMLTEMHSAACREYNRFPVTYNNIRPLLPISKIPLSVQQKKSGRLYIQVVVVWCLYAEILKIRINMSHTMQQTAGPVKRVQLQLSGGNPQPATQRQEATDEINSPGTLED